MEFSLSKGIESNWLPPMLLSSTTIVSCIIILPPQALQTLLVALIVCFACLILAYYHFKLPQTPYSQDNKIFGNVIGHRGCVNVSRSPDSAGKDSKNNLIPQGSLEAFEFAYNCGSDGIEFDIRFTKDHVPVIVHDFHFRKIVQTSNHCDECADYHQEPKTVLERFDIKSKSSHVLSGGCGKIHEMTLKQLQSYPFEVEVEVGPDGTGIGENGVTNSEKGKDEKKIAVGHILSLEQFLEHFVAKHPYCKDDNNVSNLKENKDKRRPFMLFFEFKHLGTRKQYTYQDLENVMKIIVKVLGKEKEKEKIKTTDRKGDDATGSSDSSDNSYYSANNLSNMSHVFDNIVFVSFSMSVLYKLKKKYPFVKIGLTFERHMYHNWIYKDGQIVPKTSLLYWCYPLIDPIRTFIIRWILPSFMGTNFMVMPNFLVSEYLVGHYQQKNIGVAIWRAKDRIDCKWLLSKNVTCIVDDPKMAMQCRNEMLQQLKQGITE